MSDDKKLPIPVQLVGVTAVLVFCFTSIGIFNLVRAFWLNREAISSVDGFNQLELFTPLFLLIVKWAASLFTFLALLFRTVRRAALIAVVYLVLLLIFWIVQFIGYWLAQSIRPQPQTFFAIGIGVQIVYLLWYGGLLAKVWSDYSATRGDTQVTR